MRLAIANLGTRLFLTQEAPGLAVVSPGRLFESLVSTESPADAELRAAELIDMVRHAPADSLPLITSSAAVFQPTGVGLEGIQRVLLAIADDADKIVRALEKAVFDRPEEELPSCAAIVDAALARSNAARGAAGPLAELSKKLMARTAGEVASSSGEADAPEHTSLIKSHLKKTLESLQGELKSKQPTQPDALIRAFQSEADPKEATALAMRLVFRHNIDKTLIFDLLKSPNCVGLPRYYLLTELENKTRQQFGGNVWSVVSAARRLGLDVQ